MSNEKSNDEMALQKKLERIKHVFIILSGKGGVGKSTVAVNLALSLSLRGFRTGILDVDIHGPSVPKLLGLIGKRVGVYNDEIMPIELHANLKVVSMGLLLDGNEQAVIWRGPLKANVIREFVQNVAWGDLDCLVVDCPPGTGDEPLSVAQLLGAKGGAVIVTTPQQVATIDVEKCITFCRQLNLPIVGVIENMSGFVCPHCGKEVDIFSTGGGVKLAENYGVPFLGTIPLDPDIVKSGDEERPYMYFYSKTKTAERFDEIVDKITNFEKACPEVVQKDAADRFVADPRPQDQANNKEVAMKFAIPTYQGKLCAHFGHCEAFALIDTDSEGKVMNENYVTPPPHEPGVLPAWLSQQGVNCIIAGGMGSRAQQLFAQQGVSVVTGAQGEYPREIVEQYLKGILQTGANTCDH
ncbi:MAG TPA: iron-sulfur cluster carrier protein MrpORP [Syntrophorhabdaceae bacterium]|nr:iron-sulfur cluster carrier protein MrpORP [Syntrophorhabdaceae bacterium]HQM82176.1 iron-sulfur cluster carrier protein MrpORP [Syntrophorhabdaceae bacterium]